LNAKAAIALGLAEHLPSATSALVAARERATALARRPAAALSSVKRSLLEAQDLGRDEAIRADARRFRQLATHEDAARLVEDMRRRYAMAQDDVGVAVP
ncbi:MAG: hypothetical protein ABR549_12350, partial [Mycobacteriales bacterium]